MEPRFFIQGARASGLKERRAMIDRARRPDLSVRRQCEASSPVALGPVLRAGAHEPGATRADAQDRRSCT